MPGAAFGASDWTVPKMAGYGRILEIVQHTRPNNHPPASRPATRLLDPTTRIGTPTRAAVWLTLYGRDNDNGNRYFTGEGSWRDSKMLRGSG